MSDLEKNKETPLQNVVKHAQGWRSADKAMIADKNSATKLAEYQARQKLRVAVDAAKAGQP